METIYSRDSVCHSTNNNSNRDFFFILTNSNGDSAITEDDSSEVFNTTELANGLYLLEVVVRDNAMNEVTAQMPVYIANIVVVESDPYDSTDLSFPLFGKPLPNPFNARTLIPMKLHRKAHVRVGIYNIQGCFLGTVYDDVSSAGWLNIPYNATNQVSGVYIYQVRIKDLYKGEVFGEQGKLLLLK
jgi:hypothetical protein